MKLSRNVDDAVRCERKESKANRKYKAFVETGRDGERQVPVSHRLNVTASSAVLVSPMFVCSHWVVLRCVELVPLPSLLLI